MPAQKSLHSIHLFQVPLVTPAPFPLTVAHVAVCFCAGDRPWTRVAYSRYISPLVIEAGRFAGNKCAVQLVDKDPHLEPVSSRARIQKMIPGPAAFLDFSEPVQ